METNHYQVEFEKFTFGGESLGHMTDGRTIFCPFVLPGEEALVQPVFEKKRYVRAMPVEIVSVSEERISPRCIHFGECGGCHYQHVSYVKQAQVKEELVIETLQRIAGIEKPPVIKINSSEQPYYYRNSINFQVDEQGVVGFYLYNQPVIFPVKECHLPVEGILKVWQQIDLETFPGLKNIHFREGADGEIMVILESENVDNLPEMEVDLPVSVVHQSPAGIIVMAGDDHLIFEIRERNFRVSASSFFQINQAQAEKMVGKVIDLIQGGSGRLLELYSGVGLFTAFCAPLFQEIVAIEESPSACDDFVTNLDEFGHISLFIGRVEDILPGLTQKFDVVLLDPPRSGLDNGIIDAVCALEPEKIIYVSCDVATLARDVKKLIAQGYQLIEITPFDMFPQTYHIETISLLKKEG